MPINPRTGAWEPDDYDDGSSAAMDGLQASQPDLLNRATASDKLRGSPALSALSTLQGGGNPGADQIAGRMQQESRLDEMQRNRELAAASGGRMTTGATGGDVQRLQSDLNTDPTFGVAERAKNQAYTGALQKANMAGFATPQEAAAREQRMEQEKLNMPLAVAKTAAGGGIEEAKIKAEAAQRLQETSGQPEYYRGLANTLGMQGDAGRDINSVNKSGVTFAHDKPANLAPLYGALRQAQAKYDASKSLGWSGYTGDPALKAQVDQIQQQINAQGGGAAPTVTGAAPGAPQANDAEEMDSYAQDLMGDVDTKNLSWAQLQRYLDPSLTPAHKQHLQQILMQKRGF